LSLIIKVLKLILFTVQIFNIVFEAIKSNGYITPISDKKT